MPRRLWIEGGYFTAATLAAKEGDRVLGAPGPEMPPEMGSYFSELLMLSNFVLSWVPRPFTMVMIAIAIPAAIRPYSMAVAPDSSLKNDLMIDFMDWLRPGVNVPGTQGAPVVPSWEPTGIHLRLA